MEEHLAATSWLELLREDGAEIGLPGMRPARPPESTERFGMTIRVFVQNEAGSHRKNYHDEKTLAFSHSRIVSHAYPFPYGFIIGTDAGDGCSVDCFVVTDRPLSTGQIVECEPLGLMEQLEDGVEDHNVLARPMGEGWEVTGAVEAALTEHVLECFRHVEGKQMRVGRFLGGTDAEAHVLTHTASQAAAGGGSSG